MREDEGPREAWNEKNKPDQEANYMSPREFETVLSERIRFTFQKGYPIILRAEVEKNMFLFQQEGIPNKEDVF